MTSLGRILDDFKQRRNLDVYLTIVAAVVVSVLSYFDVVPGPKVAGLILAVLAVLAFNALTTRVAIADAVERIGGGGHHFHADFPAEVRPRREASDDIYLIGVDLNRTIETSYGAFERALRRGGRIRILLTDPDADDVAVDARCQISRPAVADLRRRIWSSLRDLTSLKSSVGGDLEVRTTRTPLKFGLNFVDAHRASATLFVQLYTYRLAGESRPHFQLTHSDGEWFECYRDQAETLWRDSPVFDPDRLPAP